MVVPVRVGAAYDGPTVLPLDTRQARIARRLLDGASPTSVEVLASELDLTPRVVRYNLPSVGAFLLAGGVRLVRRRGVGVWLEGEAAARRAVQESLDIAIGPPVVDATDRRARIVVGLLDAFPDPLRLETLENELAVSRPTVRRDVRAAEAWLEGHRLHLRRKPGVGVVVLGSETEIRGGLLAILLESVPAHALADEARMPSAVARRRDPAPTGLAPFVAELDLPTFRAVLEPEVGDVDDRGLLTASIALAIAARRIRRGRPARLAGGRLRSLLDHPASEIASRIASRMAATIGQPLGNADVAAITESLLGLVELAETRTLPGTRELRLIDRIVGLAADRLHPSLADDIQLRDSLLEHLHRLRIRLRYGVPVSNPLQHEVRSRYPEVYAAATDILAEVGSVGGIAIPPEEVSFLTMYLAGSLERHRLRPKIRVTVVCPAGMATAWILVSRLLAEFPQVEIAQVVSKAAFELDPAAPPTDLIVSTVPLEREDDVGPSLVVSPLLREQDVRRLSRILGAPAH
jgi:mannitol operon transcriptional activator